MLQITSKKLILAQLFHGMVNEITAFSCKVRYVAHCDYECIINHSNIAWMSMLVWLTLPFYDFLRFSIRRR